MSTFQCETSWTGDLSFLAQIRTHQVKMDTKPENGGTDLGPTPKEMLLAGICGCSGMDVASILKKMRLNLEKLDVNAVTETTETQPAVFKEVKLQFKVNSPDAKIEQVMKSVVLSMTKYCGVSAMVVAVSPITYEVYLNDQKVGEGKADFSTSHSS